MWATYRCQSYMNHISLIRRSWADWILLTYDKLLLPQNTIPYVIADQPNTIYIVHNERIGTIFRILFNIPITLCNLDKTFALWFLKVSLSSSWIPKNFAVRTRSKTWSFILIIPVRDTLQELMYPIPYLLSMTVHIYHFHTQRQWYHRRDAS